MYAMLYVKVNCDFYSLKTVEFLHTIKSKNLLPPLTNHLVSISQIFKQVMADAKFLGYFFHYMIRM